MSDSPPSVADHFSLNTDQLDILLREFLPASVWHDASGEALTAQRG